MVARDKLEFWFSGEPEEMTEIDKAIKAENQSEIEDYLETIQSLTKEEKERYCVEMYESARTMIWFGDETSFIRLLKLVPDLVVPPMDGINLLGTAIEYGRYDSMKALLEFGADPNSVGDVSEGGIGYASYAEHDQKLKMVKLLIQYGADVVEDFPEVIRCCDDEEILEFLYDYLKASGEKAGCYKSLIAAISNDKTVEFVEKLLHLGALEEINQVDGRGWTLLDCVNELIEDSFYKNASEIKELLERHGAKPGEESVKKILQLKWENSKYFGKWSEVSSKEKFLGQLFSIENLKESLIKACHLNGEYNRFDDLICKLLYYGEISLVKRILDEIGDYAWVPGDVYEVPGPYIGHWTEKEWQEYFELMQKFASEDIPIKRNPLIGICGFEWKYTSQYSQKTKEIITKILDFYVNLGADINEKVDVLYSYSPLAAAVFHKNLLCVDYLLNAGVKVEKCKKQPLVFNLFSVYPGDLLEEERKLYFKLKKYGLDIDEVNESGDTVLHKYCKLRKLRKVQLIVECGARTDIKDQEGKTAAELTKENGAV